MSALHDDLIHRPPDIDSRITHCTWVIHTPGEESATMHHPHQEVRAITHLRADRCQGPAGGHGFGQQPQGSTVRHRQDSHYTMAGRREETAISDTKAKQTSARIYTVSAIAHHCDHLVDQ